MGVVGARSGSKSIKDKNIKPLFGKPLMGWVIEAAKKSKFVNRLIISTDSEKYAELAKKYGAESLFLRPGNLADDQASDIDYLTHATLWMEQNANWKPDIILRLPPTTPLCKTESIDACIQLLLDDKEATSCRTITKASKHPYKLWKKEGNRLVSFIPKELTGFDEPSNMPRQAFPGAYTHVDIIAVRYDTLIKDKLLTGEKTLFHEIPKGDAVDIDDENDFLLAEILLKKRLGVK